MTRAQPFTLTADGLRLALRVTPRARRNQLGDLWRGPDGRTALKVAVAAVPEKGAANEAALDLLAEEWRLPRARLRLEQGASDRLKLVHIAGDPTALATWIAAWLTKTS